MAESKTRETDASVDDHLAAIASDEQRADCRALVELLRRVTGEEPRMWGPSIVGFGSYHYRYESGREGDACRVGFAARKSEIVVYLVSAGPEQEALLARLGKHRKGKACLYVRRLAEVDLAVLELVVRDSLAETARLHG